MLNNPIPDSERSRSPRDFGTTHWSVVLKAGTGSQESQSALEVLCRNYWYPLYVFVRRRGHGEHEAQDLTQEFFARLLASDSLQAVSPEKGRFRTFLLAAMKNFLAKEWRDGTRLKRGGGTSLLSWEELDPERRYLSEIPDDTTPELVFDRRWAQAVVRSGLDQLRYEFRVEGNESRFDTLKVFLQGATGASYASVAAGLGMTESAVKSAIHRMRRRYGEIIRESIARTVADPADVDVEIQHLMAVLSGE